MDMNLKATNEQARQQKLIDTDNGMVGTRRSGVARVVKHKGGQVCDKRRRLAFG